MGQRQSIFLIVLIGAGIWVFKHFIFQSISPRSTGIGPSLNSTLVPHTNTTLTQPLISSPPHKIKPIPEHLENLNVNEIETLIIKTQNRLEESQAIERLNNPITNHEDRRKIGEQLKELDQLRERNFTLHLAEIENKVSALENAHVVRLQTYGVKKP